MSSRAPIALVELVRASGLDPDDLHWVVREHDGTLHASTLHQGCKASWALPDGARSCVPTEVLEALHCDQCLWGDALVVWATGLPGEASLVSEVLRVLRMCQAVLGPAPTLTQVEAFASSAHQVLYEYASSARTAKAAYRRAGELLSVAFADAFDAHLLAGEVQRWHLIRARTWRCKGMLRVAVSAGRIGKDASFLVRTSVLRALEAAYLGFPGRGPVMDALELDHEPSEAEREVLEALLTGELSLTDAWEAAQAL